MSVQPAEFQPAAEPDHRSRVAERKRQQMRERLVQATLTACVASPHGRLPVVDDVVQAAGVSRGSFYKHFTAVDEVLAEIGQRMAAEMLACYEHLAAPLADAAARVALGPLMAMARCVMEPSHGVFISRVDFISFLATDTPRVHLVAHSLTEAQAAGTLHFAHLDAATDLLVGASLEGQRRVLRNGQLDGAYLRALAAAVLRGLGADAPVADAAVALAWQRLLDESPRLAWWRAIALA